MITNGFIPGRIERGRVTLQDIADQLSVSTATVSLALRDAPVVADATRTKVQKLARELGYIYNRSAASLRTSRSNMLAVGFHDITNPYFSEMLSALEESASRSGRTLILGTYAESLDRQERVLSTLREYNPDGMILCPAGGTTRDSYDPLIAAGIPVVQVSREIEGIGLDFVGTNNEKGITLAFDYLHSLGHRRIAMLGGNDLISTGRERRHSYRENLEKTGIAYDPTLVYEGFGSREVGLKAIHAMLALKQPPTAAICFNDLVAFGAMLGLRHHGKEAGGDFSIVGCDDVHEAALWHPALTTIRNEHDAMGRAAADLLIRRIEDPTADVKRIILDPTLIIRGSAARLN